MKRKMIAVLLTSTVLLQLVTLTACGEDEANKRLRELRDSNTEIYTAVLFAFREGAPSRISHCLTVRFMNPRILTARSC